MQIDLSAPPSDMNVKQTLKSNHYQLHALYLLKTYLLCHKLLPFNYGVFVATDKQRCLLAKFSWKSI